jgi:hypothetical protein
MDAKQQRDDPINKKVKIYFKNTFLNYIDVRKTFSQFFFVTDFLLKLLFFLGLYPKPSLSDRDIFDCSHTVGVI